MARCPRVIGDKFFSFHLSQLVWPDNTLEVVPYVPRAKLDGAEEGGRKDLRKMPMRGQDWSNQVRQMVVPSITSKPHDNKAASKKPHFFTKRERTWTEVVAIVKAFECVLDHTHCYPETSNDSNIFCYQ
jgi:hypothetical protein